MKRRHSCFLLDDAWVRVRPPGTSAEGCGRSHVKASVGKGSGRCCVARGQPFAVRGSMCTDCQPRAGLAAGSGRCLHSWQWEMDGVRQHRDKHVTAPHSVLQAGAPLTGRKRGASRGQNRGLISGTTVPPTEPRAGSGLRVHPRVAAPPWACSLRWLADLRASGLSCELLGRWHKP